MIGKVGERLSWISVLRARHDDDDDDDEETQENRSKSIKAKVQ